MKRIIYIISFTILGILVSFLIHGVVEIWYIRLLVANFNEYSLGLTYDQLYTVHLFWSIGLLILGTIAGLWQGFYWWRKIYIERIFLSGRKGADGEAGPLNDSKRGQ